MKKMEQILLQPSSPTLYTDLSKYAVDYIKDSILKGKLKSGDRLIENDLSKDLGISRGPLREGIRELEKSGIVTNYPRRGTYISEFTSEDIKEIFDVRLLLENDIIDILIKEEKITEENIEELTTMVDYMVRIVNSDLSKEDKTNLINLEDMEFHRYIWNLSGSKRRVEMLNSMFFQLRMAMLYDTNKTDDLLRTAKDHYKIIEGFKEKDADKIKSAIRDHIITI